MAAKDFSYGKQKFYEAVDSLVGAGSLQDRLSFAAVALLTLRSHTEDYLPEDLHERFDALVKALTTVPLSSASGYTARPLTDDDGRALAHEIFSIYTQLMGGL